jgi:hypothetical protein
VPYFPEQKVFNGSNGSSGLKYIDRLCMPDDHSPPM